METGLQAIQARVSELRTYSFKESGISPDMQARFEDQMSRTIIDVRKNTQYCLDKIAEHKDTLKKDQCRDLLLVNLTRMCINGFPHGHDQTQKKSLNPFHMNSAMMMSVFTRTGQSKAGQECGVMQLLQTAYGGLNLGAELRQECDVMILIMRRRFVWL